MRGECVPAHAGRRLHFEGVTDLVRLLSAGGKHLRSVNAPIMKTGSMREHAASQERRKEGLGQHSWDCTVISRARKLRSATRSQAGKDSPSRHTRAAVHLLHIKKIVLDGAMVHELRMRAGCGL